MSCWCWISVILHIIHSICKFHFNCFLCTYPVIDLVKELC